MALTEIDLQSIEKIVLKTVDRRAMPLGSKIDNLGVKIDKVETRLSDRIERTESRLIAAMDMLRRDTFSRFEDHEKRIAMIERKLTSS